jgi:hypothetical protein
MVSKKNSSTVLGLYIAEVHEGKAKRGKWKAICMNYVACISENQGGG